MLRVGIGAAIEECFDNRRAVLRRNDLPKDAIELIGRSMRDELDDRVGAFPRGAQQLRFRRSTRDSR